MNRDTLEQGPHPPPSAHPKRFPEQSTMNGHIFKCQLCKQPIQRGKSLNCHHAFCHHCIQNSYISSKFPDKVACPVKACHQTTPLPSKIIADLTDFNEKEILGLLKNTNLIEEFAEVGSDSVSSTTALTKAAGTLSTTMAPSGQGKVKGANSEVMSSLKSVQIQLSETKSSSTLTLTSNKANDAKPSKQSLSTGVRSTLQTPEQIQVLKAKQSHFNKQMSTPDQTSPPPMEGTSSSNHQHRRLQRSQSAMLPDNNTIIKLNKPKYMSTLKNDEERAALQRMIERNKIKPKAPKMEPVQEIPKSKGFTCRTSKRRAPRGTPIHGNVFQGGLSSFFLSAKQSEFEFRGRAEGPWGYQDWDHWGGRAWGEAD